MAGISSIGLSGLPLSKLLQDLQNNENQALAVIKSRQTAAEDKVSSYGRIKNAIASFQKAAEDVGKAEAFGSIAAKAGSDAFSVSTTNKAIAGQYSIQVDSLATAQTLVYDGRGSRTDAIGTDGKVTFTVNGEEKTLDLTGKDTSLDGLVKAINSDANLGVNATIVNNGTDGSQYQLLLTNRDTGTEAAVSKIQVEGNTDLQTFLQHNGTDGPTVSAAKDASLSINGIAISSQTNTIEDVIDGVTLTLNKTTTEATSLSLTQDPSVAKKAIEGFVKAYNTLLSTIKVQTSYDMESQTPSPLTGDSIARSVQTRMRDAISSGFSAVGSTNLGEIGINTDPKTGEMVIDSAKLDKALAESTEGVKSLFTSDTGIAKRVVDTADSFIKSDGMLTTTTTSMEKTVADIKKQYDITGERINQRMDTYRAQFTQLDVMVSQMNTLSSYLTQQLSALSAQK